MLKGHITIKPDDLLEAAGLLEAEGFAVHSPPPVMVAHGVLLAAYRAVDGEGFLLSGPEVALVARYGSTALDPHREPSDARPRWERPDQPDRAAKYAEAALARAVAEVSSAPPGQRNITLSRCAFNLGGLLHFGLQPSAVEEALVEVAIAAGLGHAEAESTARRALRKGSERPRELPERVRSSWAGKKSPWEDD